jgi:phytoene dehydrogenase-like protein
MLQGATVKDAPTTLMAYMLSDFYRPNVCLDFPKGGTASIVHALERGVNKHAGCEIRLNAHVEALVEEGGRAAGVVLRGGKQVRAREAVVCNADLWSTLKIVEASGGADGGRATAEGSGVAAGAAMAAGAGAAVAAGPAAEDGVGAVERAGVSLGSGVGPLAALASELRARTRAVGRCSSFLHLHLGIDGAGLPTSASEAFPAQWAVVEDWGVGVDAPRNTVLVSMASLLDASLAPEGQGARKRKKNRGGRLHSRKGIRRRQRTPRTRGEVLTKESAALPPAVMHTAPPTSSHYHRRRHHPPAPHPDPHPIRLW